MAAYNLRDHQGSFKDFYHGNGYIGATAWHGMGLGKTLTSLDIASDHLGNLRAMGIKQPKALIVMPKSALSTWQTECMKWTRHIYRDLLFLPYSQLHKAKRLASYHDIRLIVCDEWHYVKNPETQRAADFASLIDYIGSNNGYFHHGRILPLTGTPMPNGAHEFYTAWALCATDNIKTSAERLVDLDRYTKWKQTFSTRKETSWYVGKGKKKHGSTHEGINHETSDQLAQLLNPIVHFRRVEDCVDLPEKEEIKIDLGMPDDKLLEQAQLEEPEAYMALVAKLNEAKTPHMLAWVQDFLRTSQEQLIVFCMHRHPIDELTKKHPKLVARITGEESAGERKANIEAFQKGKRRIAAMTYRAGSEALNFQNCAISLYQGYPWTDGMLKQAMARTFRSGQTRRTLHYFLTSGYNDMRILDRVLMKEEATTAVENRLLDLQGQPVKMNYKLESFI